MAVSSITIKNKFVKLQQKEKESEIDETISQYKRLLLNCIKYLKKKNDISIENLSNIIESRILDLKKLKKSNLEIQCDNHEEDIDHIYDNTQSCTIGEYNVLQSKNVRFQELKTIYLYDDNDPVYKIFKKKAYLSTSISEANIIKIVIDLAHLIITSDCEELDKSNALGIIQKSFYLDENIFQDIVNIILIYKYPVNEFFMLEGHEYLCSCFSGLDSHINTNVDMEKNMKYLNLFKILFSFNNNTISENPQKNVEFISTIKQVQQLFSLNFSLFKPIDVFKDLPFLKYDFILTHKLSTVSYWILNLYSSHLGISEFYRRIIFLEYIVSQPTFEELNLIIIYILLLEILELIKDKDFEYSDKEYWHFTRIIKALGNDIRHYLRNIFQYISNDNVTPLKILHHICCLIDQFCILSSNLSSSDCLKKALEHSIRNYYQSILNFTKDEKDPNIGDPIGTNSSILIQMKRRKEENLKANQLIKMFYLIIKRIENLENFESIFKDLNISVRDLSCSIYFNQYFVHVRRFIMINAVKEPTFDVLKLGFIVSKINKLYIPKLKDVEEISVEFLFSPFYNKWLDENEKKLNDWIAVTCKIENWESLDLEKSQIWSQSCIDVCKRITKLLKLSMELGNIFCNNNSTSSKVFEIIKNGLKIYIENIYSQFIEEFPNYLDTKLHDLYIKEILGKNNLRYFLKEKRSFKYRLLKLKVFQNLNKIQNHTYISKCKERFDILPSMCIKINNILKIKLFIQNITNQYIFDSTSLENLSQQIDEVVDEMIKLIVYSLNSIIKSEIQLFLKSSKDVYDLYTFTTLYDYIANQITILNIYTNQDIFQSILQKLWNEQQECLISLLECKKLKDSFNSFKRTIIRDVIENIKLILNFNNISTHYITEIDNILMLPNNQLLNFNNCCE